jgi:hypothetical protein
MIDRDTIIKLAREAGFREPNPHDGCMGLAFDYRGGTDTGASLERFAALVAAAEREQCAKLCDFEVVRPTNIEEPRAALAAGICAAVIRARSNP